MFVPKNLENVPDQNLIQLRPLRPMHVSKFLTELQNVEIPLVTLLESNSTTFQHREVILPEVLKLLGTLTGHICSSVSLQ